MRTLNLGILAHVDAGKTTLTERLLYSTGAIDHVGSVDAGTTQTDSLDLERERGITIRSAVASFLLGDLTVNLVDTPGHPDFIAEVERVLTVLDGAILVVSAVEGVQPQTPLLMRALQRLRVPTLIFVNKIDRPGADDRGVLDALRRRLSSGAISMGSVHALGTRSAGFIPATAGDRAFVTALAEVLAEHDDGLLRDYVQDESGIPYARLRSALAAQVGQVQVHPVFFGSALSGAGVEALLGGVAELVPAADGDPEAAVSGRVFKIERAASGERVAYVRLFSGSIKPRTRMRVGDADDAKATAVTVFAPRSAPRSTDRRPRATWRGSGAGRRYGSATRSARCRSIPPEHRFPLPTLESVVVARRPDQSGSLRAALAQLAEQDPLINVRQDDRDDISVSLYGDVQKEVIQATLERDYGIAADFRETTTLCIERPARTGEAEEILQAPTKSNVTGRSSPTSTNPFLATLALRVEPAPPGSGIAFAMDVDVRLVPLYIFRTVETMTRQMESYVREALAEGLSGWPVTDCRVTMTDCGYRSPGTTAADFRKLTLLVLFSALDRAGTWVCEPLANLALEVPTAAAPGVLAALGRLGGRVRGQFSAAGLSRVDGVLPVARLRELQQRMSGLTGGEGVLDVQFGGYQPVGDHPPRRPRTTPNPLNRDEFLMDLARRG